MSHALTQVSGLLRAEKDSAYFSCISHLIAQRPPHLRASPGKCEWENDFTAWRHGWLTALSSPTCARRRGEKEMPPYQLTFSGGQQGGSVSSLLFSMHTFPIVRKLTLSFPHLPRIKTAGLSLSDSHVTKTWPMDVSSSVYRHSGRHLK
jgi:hypothetical protein